jgi:hypothetical protein
LRETWMNTLSEDSCASGQGPGPPVRAVQDSVADVGGVVVAASAGRGLAVVLDGFGVGGGGVFGVAGVADCVRVCVRGRKVLVPLSRQGERHVTGRIDAGQVEFTGSGETHPQHAAP